MHLFWEIIWQVTRKASTLAGRSDTSAWLARFNAQWNPTGDVFDVRPDLTRLSLEELADAVIAMRHQLVGTTDELARVQISRFERQYSFALFQRAKAASAAAVVVGDLTYGIVLTTGGDVVLLPQSHESES